MGKISYRIVMENDITKDFLKNFKRYQEVKKINYVKDGKILIKNETFVESWDEADLERISLFLKEISKNGAVLAAYYNDRVVGFACIENEIFNEFYINMPYIHVSNDFRRKGIGKIIFKKIMELAKQKGAKKLYISGHPAIETQAFYKKYGCKIAAVINQKLFAEEPYDIHLERELSDTKY